MGFTQTAEQKKSVGMVLTSPDAWHTKSEEKEKLVNLINFYGFVLEDRVRELLSGVFLDISLKSGAVYIRPGVRNVERVEIDAWFRRGHHYFIFEVKTSVYDWIFLKGPNTSQHFHLMQDSSQGFHTKANPCNERHPFNVNVTEVGFEVLSNRLQGGTSLQTGTRGGKAVQGLNLPERPDNREIIRPAAKQLFKNLETLVYHEMFESSQSNPRQTHGCMFLPFLVTNAPLFVASYDCQDVSKNGTLASLSKLEEVPWLVCNYQEILHWDCDLRQQVKHLGWHTEDLVKRTNYKDSHLKSIFVVQYQQLDRFLKSMG